MGEYAYTRSCPDCGGVGEELWAEWGEDVRRSGVVCARCDGDGVIDVYVDGDDAPVVLYGPLLEYGEDGTMEGGSR